MISYRDAQRRSFTHADLESIDMTGRGQLRYISGVLFLVLVLACASCGSSEQRAPGTSEGQEDAGTTDEPRDDLNTTADGGVPDIDQDTSSSCRGNWQPTEHGSAADDTFLRGPFLQQVEGDRATIVWRLGPGSAHVQNDGCVTYDIGGTSGERCVAPDLRGQYELSLSGLPRATELRYRVHVGELQTRELRFRTAPENGAPVRLLVVSDGHVNADTLPQIAAQGLADGVDMFVSIGDHVEHPLEGEFDRWFALVRPLLHYVPWWPSIGNHEAVQASTYFDAVSLEPTGPAGREEAWYAARVGNLWFASLEYQDINLAAGFGVDTPELTWLREQLASTEAVEATWRLFFIHESPWCAGWGHCPSTPYDGEYTLRSFLIPLAAENEVSAIFSGDMHGYGHGVVDGVHLVVTGGGGGALDHACPRAEDFPSPWFEAYEHHRTLVETTCDSLIIEARSLDDALIERIEIPR